MYQLLLFFLFSFSFSISAQDYIVGPWPEKTWQKLTLGADRYGLQLSESIFETLEDVKVASLSDGDREIELGVSRRIYENRDYLQSWTVIDQMILEYGDKPKTYPVPISAGFPTSLNFYLGVKGKVEWMNIHQYIPIKIDGHLPQVRGSLNLNDLAKSSSEDTVILENDGNGAWYEFSPNARPSMSKFYNLFTSPKKAPLNLKQIEKLNVGEIIAYKASGYVDLGVDVGFDIFDFDTNVEDRLINARTYLEGNYQIAILKSSETSVKVKLSYTKAKGHAQALNLAIPGQDIFNGIVVLGKNILDISAVERQIDVIPFQVERSKKTAEIFDTGYEYDLTSEEAVEALFLALKGQFGFSKEISLRHPYEDKPVKASFDRYQDQDSTKKTRRIKLGFLFKRESYTNSVSTKVIIQIPGEEKRVLYEELFEAGRQWKNIFGVNERISYQAEATYDETCAQNGQEECSQLLTEFEYIDSYTAYDELSEQINFIERVLENENVFPEIMQSMSGPEGPFGVYYGRSSFRVGHVISEEQIGEFLLVSDKEMWKIVSKAFGGSEDRWLTRSQRITYTLKNLPKTILNAFAWILNIESRSGKKLINARRFYKRWKEIKYGVFEKVEIKTLLRKIRDLLSDHLFAREIMVILSEAIESPLYTFLDATNSSFGRVQLRGHLNSEVQRRLARYEEIIDYEKIQSRANIDEKLGFSKFEFKNGKIYLDFEEKPVSVLVSFARTSGFKKMVKFGNILHFNREYFGVENILDLSKWSYDPIFLNYFEYLIPNEYYTITFAYAGEDGSWSESRSLRFFVGESEL